MSVEMIDWNQPLEVYDIMGRKVGNNIYENKANVLILKQGNKIFKIIK